MAEAEEIIKRAAKFNKVHTPEDVLKELKKQGRKLVIQSDGDEPNMIIDDGPQNSTSRKYNLCDLFRTAALCKRSLIMFYIW